MTNKSIYAAFERMWSHIMARLGGKIDKTEIATDDEVLDLLIEEDMVAAVADSDGVLLADENDNILLW